MITKEEIIEIGKFQKTHALKGELNALLDVETDYASEGHPLIVEVDGIYVPFYAESVRTKGSQACLVKLENVDTQEEAQKFVNKAIYGLRKDIKEYFDTEDEESFFQDEFIGYRLIDNEKGMVGVVEDIEASTANELFIVKTPQGKTVYVPIADEMIASVDDKLKVIRVNLPEGLLDLNN